jgi:hypothetical protein
MPLRITSHLPPLQVEFLVASSAWGLQIVGKTSTVVVILSCLIFPYTTMLGGDGAVGRTTVAAGRPSAYNVLFLHRLQNVHNGDLTVHRSPKGFRDFNHQAALYTREPIS